MPLLNQLPTWLETPQLSAPARLNLLRDMALNAPQGILRALQD